jgi:diadenosine tetraphosphate (Ap4A) HIT family hydrolase
MSVFDDKDRWIDQNGLAFTIDQIGWAVSPGHCLVCPKREVATVFDMTILEWIACAELIHRAKCRIDAYHWPDGYNIGANCGAAGGQTVMHAHIHIIPRFNGDVPDPRGGVRGVIPEKRIPIKS